MEDFLKRPPADDSPGSSSATGSPGITAADPALPDDPRSREFLVFTSSRPLTEAEKATLLALRKEPLGTTLEVFPDTVDLTMDLWNDLITPLTPGQWLTNLAIDFRLALLQQHVCSMAIGTASCLILTTYMWSFFLRDSNKPPPDSTPIGSKLQNYLDWFNLDAASITRVLIPINTGDTHWKALALDIV